MLTFTPEPVLLWPVAERKPGSTSSLQAVTLGERPPSMRLCALSIGSLPHSTLVLGPSRDALNTMLQTRSAACRDEDEEYERKVRAAKRAARSELSVSKGEWRKHGYAESDLLSTAGIVDQVERVHCSVRSQLQPRDATAALFGAARAALSLLPASNCIVTLQPAANHALALLRASGACAAPPRSVSALRRLRRLPGPEPNSRCQELTVEQFVERFERPRIPVVLTGLCDGWRAAHAWRQPELLQQYGDHKFKAGARQAASRARRCCVCLFVSTSSCLQVSSCGPSRGRRRPARLCLRRCVGVCHWCLGFGVSAARDA